MPSFTTQIPNLQVAGPIVQVRLTVAREVEEALLRNSQNVPPPIPLNALIDTGATGTVISADIVTRLNLSPVGVTLINTPSSTNVRCLEYLVLLLLPNNLRITTVAIAAPLQGQNVNCLIGRDVLKLGVLIYNGYMNTFTFSI